MIADEYDVKNTVKVKAEPKADPFAPELLPTNDDGTGNDWFSQSAKIQAMSAADTASSISAMEEQGVFVDEKGNVSLFWLDAFETPQQPGKVYLFGRVRTGAGTDTQSCCVVVENIDRNLFILPRKFVLDDPTDETTVTNQEVQTMDVYNEIKSFVQGLGVSKFGCKPVTRKFCFSRECIFDHIKGQDVKSLSEGQKAPFRSLREPLAGVPAETGYLKLVYSRAHPALPRQLKGKTFSHVFGSRSSALELFLLKRELKGPSWLSLSGLKPVEKGNRCSWCTHEFTLDNQKRVVTVCSLFIFCQYCCVVFRFINFLKKRVFILFDCTELSLLQTLKTSVLCRLSTRRLPRSCRCSPSASRQCWTRKPVTKS